MFSIENCVGNRLKYVFALDLGVREKLGVSKNSHAQLPRRERRTYKTVMASFWHWLSGKSP